jgi:hypothetical protein
VSCLVLGCLLKLPHEGSRSRVRYAAATARAAYTEIGVNGERRDISLALFDRLAYSLYWAIRDGWNSGVGPRTLKIRSERYGDRIDPGESLF